jgi:hypothetical protein
MTSLVLILDRLSVLQQDHVTQLSCLNMVFIVSRQDNWLFLRMLICKWQMKWMTAAIIVCCVKWLLALTASCLKCQSHLYLEHRINYIIHDFEAISVQWLMPTPYALSCIYAFFTFWILRLFLSIYYRQQSSTWWRCSKWRNCVQSMPGVLPWVSCHWMNYSSLYIRYAS